MQKKNFKNKGVAPPWKFVSFEGKCAYSPSLFLLFSGFDVAKKPTDRHLDKPNLFILALSVLCAPFPGKTFF